MANPADYSPYVAEIQRIQSALAAHTSSYQPGADFGMPVALHATPKSVYRYTYTVLVLNFSSASSLCVLSALTTTITPTNSTHPQPGFVKR